MLPDGYMLTPVHEKGGGGRHFWMGSIAGSIDTSLQGEEINSMNREKFGNTQPTGCTDKKKKKGGFIREWKKDKRGPEHLGEIVEKEVKKSRK